LIVTRLLLLLDDASGSRQRIQPPHFDVLSRDGPRNTEARP
jgi:hypothetical protein